jgi:hypothetical protein
MKAASPAARSAANEAANLSRSRNRKPSSEGADESAHRLARVGREGRNVGEAGDVLVTPGLGDHGAAVGVADEDRRAVLLVEHVVRGLDVAVERERLILHDAHVEAVRRERVVDAPPAGPVDEAAVDEDYVLHVGHGCPPSGFESVTYDCRAGRPASRASDDDIFGP